MLKILSALLALIAALLLTGCVTSSDIRRIEEAQASYRIEVAKTLEELEAEAITEKQAEDQIDDAQKDLKQELEETIAQVEERTQAIAKAASHIPTDPLSLLTDIAGLGGAVVGSTKLAVKKVNQDRDQARRLRGEPVATNT